MLVVTANHKSLRAPVRALLDSDDWPDGVFVNINDWPGPFMVGRETLRIDGRSHVREDMLGTSFLISPTAFFQTNVRAARALLQVVLDEVGQASPLLDSYSGGGLFTVPLAERGAWVVAVEENRQAVRDAEANLRLNKVPPSHVRLVAERAEDAMHSLQQEMFEVVVLDSAQARLSRRRARRGLPARTWLVSSTCRATPSGWPSNASRLERGGYRLSRLQGVDMSPHTDHIEAVAVFEAA